MINKNDLISIIVNLLMPVIYVANTVITLEQVMIMNKCQTKC